MTFCPLANLAQINHHLSAAGANKVFILHNKTPGHQNKIHKNNRMPKHQETKTPGHKDTKIQGHQNIRAPKHQDTTQASKSFS